MSLLHHFYITPFAAFALKRLAETPGVAVTARSSIWRTKAWGKEDQPDFLNMCALVRTTLAEAPDAGIRAPSAIVIGDDHIMVEVDYPHGDSTWPHTQSVLRDYFRECADAFDVRRHIRFGCTVDGAEWDERTARWTVRYADDSGRLPGESPLPETAEDLDLAIESAVRP